MNEEELNFRMQKRFEGLFKSMNAFLFQMGATEYAYISVNLLGKAVLDFFEDIERLID